MKRAIIVFQKEAVSGKVKTRLAQRIGDAQALHVYQYLIAHTHRQLAEITADIFVFFAGEAEGMYSNLPNYHSRQQCEGDLGVRMVTAFKEVFDTEYDQVLVIGTDCYELQSGMLKEAFQALDHSDMVIGPAKDGGYYLLGLTQLMPELFNGISWSTSRVKAQTMEIASSLGTSVYELPVLSDVDRYEDLGELASLLGVKPKEL